MKRYLLIFAIISFLIFFQNAIAEEKQETASNNTEVAPKSVEKVRIPEIFGTRQIRDWQVIDNKTIIIDTYGYGKFKATFMMSCLGIPFTDTIGFLTHGPYALDESTTVILSDGERCNIMELVPYVEEE